MLPKSDGDARRPSPPPSWRSHVLEFVTDWWADLERAPGRTLEQILIRKGSRRRAQVRPHILPGPWGPVESADLCFEDGTTVFNVHYAAFAFVD